MIYNSDTLSFQVLTVMRSKHISGEFNVRRRPYAAISFKIRGSADFELEGEKLTVNEKDIVFVPANVDYHVKYHEENDSVIIHLLDCNCNEPQSITVKKWEYTEMLFLNLLQAWSQNHSANQAKSGIYNILFNLACGESSSNYDRFVEITEYMKEHYVDANLNVSSVSHIFYISRSCIQELFLKCAGIPPKQYLINLRMEKALFLLAEEHLSIKDISLQCGFSDEKYFSRAFKKKYGYSPSQLRKHMVL
jgi:AraC-like DNA-binding protein